MFSSTAYEAMYQYIGLALHAKFIEVITSQKIFLGVFTLIFGVMFFMTTVEFFSRYMPGSLVKRRSVPLSKFVKITFFLILGIGFLKVGSNASVKRFNGESWNKNPYVLSHIRDVAPQYKVSFLFDILSRSAEEISALIARVIDSVFQSTHSELDAPDFFFKAIMYAGSETIDDPKLKKSIQFYTEECFDRILPFIKEKFKGGKFDKMFATDAAVDSKLSDVYLERPDKKPYNCLNVKNEVRDQLRAYADKTTGGGDLMDKFNAYIKLPYLHRSFSNYHYSQLLVNSYVDQHEGSLGIQKGAEVKGATGRVIQNFNRFFSWDGLLSLAGFKDLQGASMAATRAQEFSENVARAPHIAGFIKMLAIAAFPWLLFFVIAGYWRVLVYWWFIYFSVLLWTPIWTLLYHIMNSIALSAEVMQAFGGLSDGISLYGAQLISSRIYHLYAVYSWLQILTGTLFTGMVLFFMRPVLTDSKEETAPEGFDSGKSAAGTVMTIGKAAL